MAEPSKKRIVARIDKGSLKRVLSVSDLFAIGYGDLGSSIYYALGITALYALGATPIALLIAGAVFACTALTYAEMSSVVSEAGGSASYSRKAFNDLISFIAGWALLLDYIVTIAISSYSVAPYLQYFFPILQTVWVSIGFTVLLIVLLGILNALGSKESTRLSFVLTSLAVVTQALIIIIGFVTLVDLPQFFSHLQVGGLDKLWSPDWKDFIKGVAMAMVAYTGIESMAQLSAEAKNPSKTVPRAIVLAMGTLILMYIGISTVALSALTPQQLSTQYVTNPIAGIVEHLPFFSSILGPWIGILAAILLLVAANAGLMGASRLSFNMGEHYQLPKLFYYLHPKFKTPWVSLGFFASFASLIVIWSGGVLAFLADLYNFGAMLAFFSANIALIMHRIRYPTQERPFKIPLNLKIKGKEIPITAVVGAIATLTVWIVVVITKPQGRLLGACWMAFGLLLYVLYRRKTRMDVAGNIEIEKITISGFEHLEIKKILVATRGGAETETVQIACHVAKSFNAELTAIYVEDIPFAFPLQTMLYGKEAASQSALKRAEAIAGEVGIPIHLEFVRARSIDRAIADKVATEGFDLVILGLAASIDHLPKLTEKIIREIPCKVWFCKNKVSKK